MTEIAAHDLVQTVFCKTPGCPFERHYDRGPAAGRCAQHGKPIAVAHAVAHARRAGAQRVAQGTPGTTYGELSEIGKRVFVATKKVDRAVRDLDGARSELRDAVTELLRRMAA